MNTNDTDNTHAKLAVFFSGTGIRTQGFCCESSLATTPQKTANYQ